MRKTTGLAVVAFAMLLTACGPHTGSVREVSQPGGVGTVTEPSPTDDATADATTWVMPDPESDRSSPAPTTPTTVGTSTTTTTTAAAAVPEPKPELDIPDLGDLDALMNELDGAVTGIILTETEGDLP